MDGSGKPACKADVLVRRNRIEDVGRFPDAQAGRVIDAQGLVVAPGFIDVHTHLDFFIPSPRHPQVMERWARQGVTTIVGGNCGWSPAPINHSIKETVSTYWNFALPRDGLTYAWTSMGEYFEYLERTGLGFNVAVLTGHNLLRTNVMGFQGRFASPKEVSAMQSMLRRSLEEGSIGLSLGLFYCPGVFSHTDEIMALGSVLSDYQAPLVAHTRGLTDIYDKAIEEVIQVAERNKIPLQISHHAGGVKTDRKSPLDLSLRTALFVLRLLGKKTAVKLVTSRMIVRKKALQAIREAVGRGVVIGHDNMPWACGPTTILSLLPPWLFDGGIEKGLERLENPEIRKRAVTEMKTHTPQWPTWEHQWWTDVLFDRSVRVSGFRASKNRRYENMRIQEIAKEIGKDTYETAIDLILEEGGRIFIIGGIDDAPVGDWIMGSLMLDADCSVMTDVVGVDWEPINPVSYGAFAKVLGQFARDQRLMRQEEAVRRMTSLPARQMGLKYRGMLEKGAYADICIFDARRISCRASFKHPRCFAEGVHYLIMNGTIVIDDGRYDATAGAGMVIRR